MKKQLKYVLHYYLGTGLKFTINIKDVSNNYKDEFRDFILNDNSDLCLGYGGKPHFRPLSSLTKQITVEGYNNGEPFVPAKIISELIGDTWFNEEYNINQFVYELVNGVVKISLFKSIEVLELLLKWHFNVFNIDESQYIEIKD